MNELDKEAFTALWGVAVANYTDKEPSVSQYNLVFSVLEKYDIKDIELGIKRHISDRTQGQFLIKPANVIDHIESSRRLSSDEAWAIAVKSFDEDNTVLLTEEINRALESSSMLYSEGDKYGARKAFCAAYERYSNYSIEKGILPKYTISLGHNKERRKEVLDDAVKRNFLTNEQARPFYPALFSDQEKKITTKLLSLSDDRKEGLKEKAFSFKDRVLAVESIVKKEDKKTNGNGFNQSKKEIINQENKLKAKRISLKKEALIKHNELVAGM